MRGGWIKLFRCIANDTMWEQKPFSRGQAWVDLLILANHKDGYITVRGVDVEVKRGQVGWSEKAFSKRWGWSRGRVHRFLTLLEHQTEQKIVQHKTNVTTVITILNYERYQGCDTPDRTADSTPNDTADGHQTIPQTVPQTDTNKNNKKDKKGNKCVRFAPPTPAQVASYCKERGNHVDPQRWHDFYASKGWMVGKNKMKDWKAAVRTWEKNSQPNSQGTHQDQFGTYTMTEAEIEECSRNASGQNAPVIDLDKLKQVVDESEETPIERF